VVARRRFLIGGAAFAASLPLAGRLCSGADDPTVQAIAMAGSPRGEEVWFDPIGLWVPPGTVIRWFVPPDETQKHATAAYDPSTMNRPRRIPAEAEPWNSGYLQPGQSFDVHLTVEGVYDYFCRPHEEAGMVGRLIVGRPSGHDLEDFAAAAKTHPDWRPVPPEALRVFPAIDEIMRRKVIPYQRG
jgi:plastocyanin